MSVKSILYDGVTVDGQNKPWAILDVKGMFVNDYPLNNPLSGTWTPTITILSGGTTGAIVNCFYSIVDKVCYLSGTFQANPAITASTDLNINITIPPGITGLNTTSVPVLVNSFNSSLGNQLVIPLSSIMSDPTTLRLVLNRFDGSAWNTSAAWVVIVNFNGSIPLA